MQSVSCTREEVQTKHSFRLWNLRAGILHAFLQHVTYHCTENLSKLQWFCLTMRGMHSKFGKIQYIFLQGTVVLKLLYCMPGCTKSILAVFVYLSIFVFVHLCID